jgi:hypothetical protein
MAFPISTDWPTVVDVLQNRTDLVDIVWADDFDFQAKQIFAIQTWMGETGDMIGQLAAAGEGPAGLASPVASGGVALRLAAKAAFAAGTILSVGDAYIAGYTEKMSLDHDGIIWSLGGVDAGAMLRVPSGALGAPGTARRVQWDGTNLQIDTGAAWVPVISGGSAGSYLDWAQRYSYTEAGVPVVEIMGGGVFDGDMVGTLHAYFRVLWDTSITPPAGTISCALYDMGPKAGPLGVPRLVSTLTTAGGADGLHCIEQALTVVPAPGVPGGNQIPDSARIYEVTITSAAQAADTALVYTAGIDVR